MKLRKITLHNFRSFKKEQQLDISDYRPGLYYVTGENKVEPSLGANASGKSSLFEALTWGLFGKISTNLKAGNVGTWGIGKSTSFVVLDFEEGKIDRQWNPNKLQLNGHVVEQSALEKSINLNFDSFLYSVFISQFSAKFFDLAPADKMSVFSSIMEDVVEVWSSRSDLTKKLVNETQLQLTTLEREISHVAGSSEALRDVNYTKQIKEFELQREKDIEALEVIKSDCLKEISDLLIEQKKMNSACLKTKTTHSLIVSEKLELEKQIKDLAYDIATLQAHIVAVKKENDKLSSTIGLPKCPMCLQPVEPKILEGTIKENKTRLDRFLKEQSSADIAISAVETQHIKVAKAETACADDIRDYENRLKTIPKEITNKEEVVTRCEDRLEQKSKEANPYLSMEKENKKKIKVLERYKNYLQTEINLLKEDYEIYSFWVKGFKDIRLIAIEDALKGFEVNINNELQKLGMPDWVVELGIEAETKSGTLKRGFTITVKSPYHSEPVPFESFSGGEGQRLRLAGTLGLIDFIHSTRGSDWDIEIYDEPSQFLSEEGIKDLVETLYYRAETLQKRIFFIDQRNMKTFGEFKGIIRVVKEKEGSLIYEDVA